MHRGRVRSGRGAFRMDSAYDSGPETEQARLSPQPATSKQIRPPPCRPGTYGASKELSPLEHSISGGGPRCEPISVLSCAITDNSQPDQGAVQGDRPTMAVNELHRTGHHIKRIAAQSQKRKAQGADHFPVI